MNNVAFGKTIENVKKQGDIKLVSSKTRRNYLVSEPNYYSTKFFTGHLLAIEMKKTQITMNKLVYMGLAILDMSKIAMYDFWYDYIKPKYSEKAKLGYMDTGRFIIHVKIWYLQRYCRRCWNKVWFFKFWER